MGTDIGMIQSAYQGFAKQNYTMLDNLNTMGALVA
jgi:phage-related protein